MARLTAKRLEKQALLFWQILLDSGLSDGHSKSYDPLTIEKSSVGYRFNSYVFDYEDGGRSRHFATLEEGQVWLLHSFGDWLSDERINEL